MTVQHKIDSSSYHSNSYAYALCGVSIYKLDLVDSHGLSYSQRRKNVAKLSQDKIVELYTEKTKNKSKCRKCTKISFKSMFKYDNKLVIHAKNYPNIQWSVVLKPRKNASVHLPSLNRELVRSIKDTSFSYCGKALKVSRAIITEETTACYKCLKARKAELISIREFINKNNLREQLLQGADDNMLCPYPDE